jgi:hypothetical protein
MSNLAVRLLAEPLRSLAFGSISGTYAGVGTAFANPCRIIHITNTTDVLLIYSFDGINDHFVVAANGFILLDVTTNHSTVGGSFTISQGQRVYVKGAPTLGSTYLSVFFGANG